MTYLPVHDKGIDPDLAEYRSGQTWLIGTTNAVGVPTVHYGTVIGVVYSSELHQQILGIRLPAAEGQDKGKIRRLAQSSITRDKQRRYETGDLLLSQTCPPASDKQLAYLTDLIHAAWEQANEDIDPTVRPQPLPEPEPGQRRIGALPRVEKSVQRLQTYRILDQTGAIDHQVLAARGVDDASDLIDYLTGKSPIE